MSRLRYAAPRLVREGGVDGQPRIREVVRHRIERVAVGLHRSRRAEVRRLTAAVVVTVLAVVGGWIGPVPHHQVQPIFVPARPAGAVPDRPPPGGGTNPPGDTGQQPNPDRPATPGAASRSTDHTAPTGGAGGAATQPEVGPPVGAPVGAAAVPPPPATADTPTPLCPPQPGKKPPKPKPPHPHVVDLPDQAHNPNPPGQGR